MKQQKMKNTEGTTKVKKGKGALSLADLIVMAAITVVCGIMIFIGLGSTVAPTSYYESRSSGDYIIYEKSTMDDDIPAYLWLYICGGASVSGEQINIWQRAEYDRGKDDEGFKHIAQTSLNESSGFKWKKIAINSGAYTNAPDFKISFSQVGVKLGEAVLVTKTGRSIPLTSVYSTKHDRVEYTKIIDEQHKFNELQNASNTMMWSEYSSAESAFELLTNTAISSSNQSPFAVELVSIGIAIFGMNAFGWRFMSAFAAMLLPALMYMLAKRLFKKSYLAGFASGFLVISGMFLALGRAANADVFLVLFMLLATYFLLRFYENCGAERDKGMFVRDMIYLGLSGLCFALMFAIKVTAIIYLLLPVALIIAYAYKKSRKNIQAYGGKEGVSKAAVQGELKTYMAERNITYIISVLSYVLLSIIICLIVYIPTAIAGFKYEAPQIGYLAHIFQNFSHTFAAAFSSEGMYPALWLLGMGGEKMFAQDMSAVYLMVNPVLVWGSVIAGIWFAVSWVVGGESKLHANNMKMLQLIAAGFAAMFVPWMFFFKGASIANFYPALIFLILFATLAVKNLNLKLKKQLFNMNGFSITVGRSIIFICCLLMLVSFGLFLPLSYGITVGSDFYNGMYFFLK